MVRKFISCFLIITMLFANAAAFSAAADEPQQAVLSYIESTECKTSDGGGTYNKLYPLD